jgi:hypothetical protein
MRGVDGRMKLDPWQNAFLAIMLLSVLTGTFLRDFAFVNAGLNGIIGLLMGRGLLGK